MSRSTGTHGQVARATARLTTRFGKLPPHLHPRAEAGRISGRGDPITGGGSASGQSRDEWSQVLSVNLEAAFRLIRAASRPMMKARFGRIVSITSVVGWTGNPGQANYTATKAGMVGMIKSIAAEYAKRGVTANCIAPGLIATAMTDRLNDKQREAILSRVPAGRLGGGADVAAAAVYLASEEAAYVTGQTLHVNGGMAMI